MATSVVVIHGVGHTSPATIGNVVAHRLGLRSVRHVTAYEDGHPVHEFVDGSSGDSVVEANWADVLRPHATGRGVLLHIGYIVTSMADVAVDRIGGVTPRLFRAVLFPFTIGAALLGLATAVGVSMLADWERVAVLLALTVAVVLLTWWLQRFGRHFRLLIPWAAGVGLVFVATWYGPLATDGLIARVTSSARSLVFLASIALLTAAFAECFVRLRRERLDVRLSYGALLYLPFIAINSLMTILGLLALELLSRADPIGYAAWHAALVDGLTFDLWLLELGATVTYSILLILALLLPALGYWRGSRRERADQLDNAAGRGARDGLAVFLRLAPLLLILLGGYCVVVLLGTDGTDRDVIEIYRTSITRTLPLFAWFVGPFALALDVVGDVLFYLQPSRRHPAAIAEECRSRLQAAIRYARRQGHDVLVVAHSQGSKIAVDLRREGRLGCPLLTLGSPLESLYGRFLGLQPASADGDRAPWVNAYRSGDFVAGPISAGAENMKLGPGGHTDYWSDPRFAALVAELRPAGTGSPVTYSGGR